MWQVKWNVCHQMIYNTLPYLNHMVLRANFGKNNLAANLLSNFYVGTHLFVSNFL